MQEKLKFQVLLLTSTTCDFIFFDFFTLFFCTSKLRWAIFFLQKFPKHLFPRHTWTLQKYGKELRLLNRNICNDCDLLYMRDIAVMS